jgi:hypothetical protein
MCIRNAYVSVAVNGSAVTSRYQGTRDFWRFITVREISKFTRNKRRLRHIHVKMSVPSKVSWLSPCHTARFSSNAKALCTRREKEVTLSYLLTYLLTPRSRVLLEKPTGYSASQKIPSILWDMKVHYRIHKCPSLSLSWASSIQFISPLPTSWRSILILFPTFQRPYSDQCHSQLPCKFAHLELFDRYHLSICEQSDWQCSHQEMSGCTAGKWDRNQA